MMCALRRYWHGRSIWAIFVSGLLNVLALGFTVVFSAFLLLFVNWSALHSECIVNNSCDISTAVVFSQPFKNRSWIAAMAIIFYLLIFGLYWIWTLVHFAFDMREMHEVRIRAVCVPVLLSHRFP